MKKVMIIGMLFLFDIALSVDYLENAFRRNRI